MNLSHILSIFPLKKVAKSSQSWSGLLAASIGLLFSFPSILFTNLNSLLQSFCAEYTSSTMLALLLNLSIVVYLFFSLVNAFH